jgi:hypothetical protein
MSARFLVLAFLVAAPSAFAAGHWQGEHAPVEDDQLAPRVNAPIITRPGTGAAEAVRYLSGVTAPAVVATGPVTASAPRPAPAAPVGPPPEDVSIRFRRDVTAVLTNGEPHIVLAGGRRIGRGEVYSDGWRVRDISSQRATLAKGRETRSIDLFSAPPLQPTQLAAAGPLMTGPVSFSNGLLPDQRAGQAARMTVQSQQVQQMQLLEQLRARLTQQQGQRGGFGGNNNGGNNNRGGGGGRNFNAGPNGGFGGGGFGGGGGGRQARQQTAPVVVTATPPPPPPPPAASGNAN